MSWRHRIHQALDPALDIEIEDERYLGDTVQHRAAAVLIPMYLIFQRTELDGKRLVLLLLCHVYMRRLLGRGHGRHVQHDRSRIRRAILRRLISHPMSFMLPPRHLG